MPVLTDWSHRTDAALAWLRLSIEMTGGRGASHSFSPLWGWAKAYPETTGYLIPTLLQYSQIKQNESLRQLARQCQIWLCATQMPSGAFPGGVIGGTHPSVFNTAMISIGLSQPVKKTLAEENQVLQSLHDGADWLLHTLEPDGAWRKAAYVPGFVPSYYSYAVWALLQANQILQWPEVSEKMRRALQFYAKCYQPDGTVRDWGFHPGSTAFSHTIAYTLQGFLESAVLLQEKLILEKTIQSAEGLLQEYNRVGRLAGRYDTGWRGDYSFSCPTGNAQLSVLFFRLWQITNVEKFKNAAYDFLKEAAQFQKLGVSKPNTYGALPGSVPFWGPYLRFRYPGWGAKFFLDAAAGFAY